MVEADIGSDAVDPGIETRLKSKPVQRPECFQKGLLENFSRLFAISKHVESKPQDLAVMPPDELFESLAVATLRPFDEELFFVRIVNALCGPSQCKFHDRAFRRPGFEKDRP